MVEFCLNYLSLITFVVSPAQETSSEMFPTPPHLAAHVDDHQRSPSPQVSENEESREVDSGNGCTSSSSILLIYDCPLMAWLAEPMQQRSSSPELPPPRRPPTSANVPQTPPHVASVTLPRRPNPVPQRARSPSKAQPLPGVSFPDVTEAPSPLGSPQFSSTPQRHPNPAPSQYIAPRKRPQRSVSTTTNGTYLLSLCFLC